MTKVRGPLLAGLALAVVAVIAAGCGSDDDSSSGGGASPSSASDLPPPSASAPAGSVFRRLWTDPPTLDPHQVSDVASAGILVEIYSGLVTLSTDLTVEPDLAEGWEVSDDGLTYTFTLRRNAAFQDGKRVTASDIKYSLERALHPDTLSSTVDTYLDDIVGNRDVIAGRTTDLSGVTVVDERTVAITIEEPRAYFLAKLTYPTSFVVDRENIERDGKDWVRKPNATGPFILEEYRVGELLVLRRNPNYYREPAKLERVEFILRGGAAMPMYENGEIEITGVGIADLDRVTNPDEPLNRDLVVAPPSFDLAYIGLNVNLPPFDDVKVRQALTHAINKPLIADRILANMAVPAIGILPPGFPGYNDALQGLDYDPDLAREFLAASRYAGDMPRIVITVPGTGGSVGLDMEVIIQAWEDTLGIVVEVQQVERATFLEDLGNRRLQAFAGLAWQADYPDPQDFLDIKLHSQSPLNHTGYDNSEVDRLLEAARVADEWDQRKALYNRAEQLIVDDAPWIPLWYSGERMILLKPYVRGYKITPLTVSKMREVWIEGG
jgi:ABC-type transport system substrate-binding protein